jgi:hypothetical protein
MLHSHLAQVALGLLAVIAAGLCLVPATVSAQEPPAVDRTGALRVFLDCNSCDENYLRTEITFINYVRDRADADLHVLVTTQPTGGRGTEYVLKFIGLGRFANVEQSLTYVAHETNTSDETRRGFASIFKLGLVRYVADTPLAARMKVSFDAPKQAAATVRDPWNFWTFRLSGGGNFDGEESQSEKSIETQFQANRTTDRWKIEFEIEQDYSQERFTLDEGEEFTSVLREFDVQALVVKSINNRWSVGGVGAFTSEIFSNYDARTRFAPAVEFNFFPYPESTRRILTMLYSIGVETADYREETIYSKTSETLVDHRFETSLGLQQPWGQADASVEIAQYLNQTDKYRVSANGGMQVRLFKGFSVEFSGEASRRRDQLSLRRGDATNEEILVRQRELATGYEYQFFFGLSYSFGSIFNNVVNPRFRNAGGF